MAWKSLDLMRAFLCLVPGDKLINVNGGTAGWFFSYSAVKKGMPQSRDVHKQKLISKQCYVMFTKKKVTK